MPVYCYATAKAYAEAMCGRYTLYKTAQLAERFQTPRPAFVLKDSYNVAPGQFMPVIIQSEHGRTIEVMKWGLVPSWAKDMNIGYKMINARAESVFEKPAWRGPIKYRRCLVPATGFYEWQRLAEPRTKQPYFIHPKDRELFAFAGMYDVWHDHMGNELWSFTILTTGPNTEMASLHDRMPVILQHEDEAHWLDDTLPQEAIQELLRPLPDNSLEMYPVSTDVNVVKNNENYLVYPINSR